MPGLGGSYLAGDGHHIVLRGAAPAQHDLVLAGEEPIGGSYWSLFIQDTDGAILPDTVGYFVGIDPQGQLTGQQPVQLGLAESNLAGNLGDDGVHLVVDTDTAIARAFGWFFWKPVVFVMIGQCVLERPTENLESLLAHAAPSPQETGEETHGGGDLREHVGSLPVAHTGG